jgi:D-alanyl-D-alanine carboxypeptidase
VRRLLILLVLIAFALATLIPPAAARVGWKRDLDRIVRGKPVGVHVRDDGDTIYSHASKKRRVPASNQKLLLSMALLDRLDARDTLPTSGVGRRPSGRVLKGNLYVLGRGDPSLASSGPFARGLALKPTYIGQLARKIKKAGVRRIKGRVVGSKTYFAHDWWANGWKSFFPASEIALPAALNINGNVHKGRHTSKPELRLAKELTKRLRAMGVRVGGKPRSGGAPPDYARHLVAKVESPQLGAMLRHTNRQSSNFFAEVLGKLLAVQRSGAPGTIARGARTIEMWAASHNVRVKASDSSGLSYANRVSPRGLSRLLSVAESRPWGGRLRSMLPTGDQGTLERRLKGLPVRAKTGTLENVSTLSGWVRLKRGGSWAEFSIMSRGMSKARAVQIEDRIVRLLRKRARS